MKKAHLLAAVSISALAVSSAWAQDKVASTDSGSVETVTVTGSLISRPGFSAPTPVAVVTAADLLRQAPVQIADALNILPQFGNPSAPTAGWQGTANQSTDTLNLRNLGATRTLVLLNGERVTPYGTTNAVDTSLLPNPLVKRVDVVTGGASAAYGSDAVAGVINYILDTNFVGLKGTAQYGNTTNFDYETYSGNVAYGTGFDNDRGHFITTVSYSNSPQVLTTGQMDWYRSAGGSSAIVSNPKFVAGNGQPALIHAHGVGIISATQGGVITSGALKNTQFIGNGIPVPFNPGTLDNQGVLGYGGDATTYQDYLDLGEPQLTYNGFAYASYQVTPDIKAHLDVDYAHSSGYDTNYPDVHQGSITVQSDNAFLPPSTKAALVAAGQTSFSLGSTLGNLATPPLLDPKFYGNRFQESVSGGLEGSFGDGWTWTAHAGHGEVHQINTDPGQDYKPYFNLAVDAVFAPAGNAAGVPAGTIVCRSTLTNPTNGCQPLNLFGINVVSPQAKAYVSAQSAYPPYGGGYYAIHSRQDDAHVSIQGEPFSNWAGPVSVAAGADYRSVSADGYSDPLSQTQQFYTGNFLPFHGAQNVYEGFAEVIAPLVKDSFLAKSMDFDAAGRVTTYSTSGTVETWKLGLTDQISDEYRLRATWSYDIRAPNLNELYNPGSIAGRTQFDPKTNTTPQIAFTTTGNTQLTPEISTTISGGLVVSPDWLPGLEASFDWYSINIKHAIANVSNGFDLCNAGQTAYCSLVVRNGPLINGVNQVSVVFIKPINSQQATNSGLDAEMQYNTEFWGGKWDFHAAANYTDETTTYSFGNIIDNAGSLGSDITGGGLPKLKSVLSATYTAGPFSQTVQARMRGTARYNATYAPGFIDNNAIPAVGYLDLRGSYELGYLSRTQIFYAIDNLLDTPPPSIPVFHTSGGVGFANPTRPAIYDTLGRVFRIGVRATL